MSVADGAAEDRGFLGHPRGLATLFFTEMWERFSYYGMRALLTIYLVQHFLMSDGAAQALYGAYTALVYLMPVIGGAIADRYLGARKAVTIGALLLVMGHFGMAFEGAGAKQYLTAGQEKYAISTEGRGQDRRVFIDLPDGALRLKFDNGTHAQLTPTSGGGAPLRFDEGAYRIESEKPSFLFTLVASVGLANLAQAPEAKLDVVGRGEFPIRVVGDKKLVTLGGAEYAFEEKVTSDAVAWDLGSSDSAADDKEVRRFADGTYKTNVVQEPLFVTALYIALALIIVGCGFMKANIATTVGFLYGPKDPRRDAGFSIFYMGINLGSVLATGLCGWLGIAYGWKYGFGLAGVGMLCGLLQYLGDQRYLLGKADPPKPIGTVTMGVFWILGLIAVIPVSMLLQQAAAMRLWMQIAAVVMFGAIFLLAGLGYKGEERSKLFAAVILVLFSVVFWMLFEQAGTSLSLYAARSSGLTIAPAGTAGHMAFTGVLCVVALLGLLGAARSVQLFLAKRIDAVLFGYGALLSLLAACAAGYVAWGAVTHGGDYAITSAQTQTLNPGFLVLFSYPASALWTFLGKRNAEPSTPIKFAGGLFLVGFGYLALVVGGKFFAGADFKVPLFFLALLYFLHTWAELFLSPVGLSMISKLSPARIVGLMMGVWYLGTSLAQIFASILAERTSAATVGGEVIDPAAQLQTYVTQFTVTALYGIAAGVVLLLISPLLKRAMGAAR